MEGQGPSTEPWGHDDPGPEERWVPAQPVPEPRGSPGPEPVPERPVFNWFSRDPQARRGAERFDASQGGHWVAGIVLWGAVAFMGLNMVAALIDLLAGGRFTGQVDMTSGLVVVNGLLLLLFLGVPPLVWVAGFYQGGVRAWAHALYLRFRRPVVHGLAGIGAGVGMLVLSALVIYLLTLFGVEPENPAVEELGAFITWPLVFWIALSAAVGEELFFRGFLQPRIGIVASAVLFGFLHLSYGVALQVVLPLVFGFVLSLLVVLTRSLWTAIMAHFSYNFLVGALLIVARDVEEVDLSQAVVALFF